MTCFLTPAGEPFHCGTYYPTAGFGRLLEAVTTAWRDDGERVRGAAGQIAGRLADAAAATLPPRPSTPPAWPPPLDNLREGFDEREGGFGGAPKFPPSMVVEFLLRHHERTGSATALEMVELTCERMARGGMYDQLAGGFARYSVDARLGGAALREDALRQRAAAARLRAPAPGHRLGARPARGRRDRRVPAPGPGHRRGRLRRRARRRHRGRRGQDLRLDPRPAPRGAGRRGRRLGGGAAHGHRRRARSSTAPPRCSSRPTRPIPRAGTACGPRCWPRAPSVRSPPATTRWSPPGTGWRSSRSRRAAPRSTGPSGSPPPRGAADLLLDRHVVDGRLRRSSRDGVVGAAAGVLEDHAALADGLLALHQATGAPRWLAAATELLDVGPRAFRRR